MDNWTDYVQVIGILVAAVVSIVGAVISIRNRKGQSQKTESETNLNEAQQAQIVRQVTDSTEEMYLRRLESFKDDIGLLRDELTAARAETKAVKDEAGLLEEYFFEHHQKWDRLMVEKAREAGWEIEDPPSWLAFLRSKGKLEA